MFLLLVTLGCRNKDYDLDTGSPTEDSDPAVDADGDGFPEDEDCDDSDPGVYPDAVELCDGIDNDCDGTVDAADAADAGTWYSDADADGYGDPETAVQACEAPSGSVDIGDDCDDSDAAYNPGATEDDCTDPNDYNCDGSVAYDDADGDGWPACEDCDDSDGGVNPDADEVCNGIDDDCDGNIDDGSIDAMTWYADTDGDGYGDAALSTESCDQPSGYVADDTDCDDDDGAISPAGEEICNDVDDDCDGDIDSDASDRAIWYADTDADGYGDAASTTEDCDQPSGYVSDDSDCDDTESAVNPGETEICNDIDDDCDGDIDTTATDAGTWYDDTDSDGYGDASASTTDCDQPSGTVSDDTDCDDADGDTYPGADEACDGVDNDCDGSLPRLEDDPDGDGLLACEEGLWLKNDSQDNNKPDETGTYGGSEGAALLTARGITWDAEDWSSGLITTSLLDDVGILVLYGYAGTGSLTSSEATALEDWVADGGGLLYMGYHPYSSGCTAVNALPTAWGVSCSTYSTYWSGSTSTFVSHDLTDGLSSVGGAGGETWTVASPAQTLASVSGYPMLIAIEDGDGKVVVTTDEWAFYNAGSGTYDISYGDNEVMVDNIWAWLLE